MKPEGFSRILQPDRNLKRILIDLYERGILGRMSVARILDPDFPYVDKERYESILKKADEYSRILERNGFVMIAWYKGRNYTLQITDRGTEEVLKLRETME